jgi:hypothetical protein
MGIWFLAYLTTPFRKGHVRVRVFDFNMKAQCALFPKDLTTRLTRKPFNALMDITIMLPKLLLFLKTFSRNKALKHFDFVFAGGLTMYNVHSNGFSGV